MSWTLGAEVERLTLGNGAGLSGTGNGLANALDGGTGDNLLSGLDGNDTLAGAGGADTLDGGAGADTLTGGAGADVFRFAALADSTAAARDTVSDFTAAALDKISLAPIDADAAAAGDQAFAFVGTAAFSGGGAASVRTYQASGATFVEADTGDGAADFSVRLSGTLTLSATDFIL